uniref:C3H1-type domain-containing protein n=1 Tax=Chromera velia CCMP2878 TaxID=1169474 RepID=A0A0G4GC69_9ALVE|eukprot:Cvel_4505.t1-p1 / transcript=Cvel_4505.t1 / gene=Cvel_4505 / organism=Chromera_velia_CCMP2878 / gene_product=Mucin-20, putative / transcript_product=Mucin-20, putative / location=Cvel_scaffold197:34664-40243(-) / protein_length=631 / sequence_SO=supercontig / SO=protein_coding / is_pseudo=false
MSFGGETCAGRWEITYGLGSSWEWLPCERFRRGKCDGRDCRYSHAEDVMKRRMNLCSYVAKNKNCPNKDQCRDSHDKSAHPCYGYHGYAKCPPESRCELSHSPLEESWQRKDFTKFYFDKLAYKLRKERENGKTPTFWWTGLVDAETARRAAVKDGFAKYIEQRGTGGNRKRQSESGGEGKNPSETSRKVPRHQKAPSSEAHHQIQMTWHDLHAKNDRGVACSAPNLENLAPLIQKTPGMQREEDTSPVPDTSQDDTGPRRERAEGRQEEDTSPVPDTSQDDTGPRRERAEGRQVAPQMSSYASGKGGHTGPCFDFQAFGACSKRNDSPDSHQQMCISEALDFVHKHAPQLSKLIEEAPQDHTNRWWYGLLKFNKRTPNPDLDEAAERGYRALHPRPPSQSLYSTLRPQFNNPRPAGANLHLNSVPNPPPPPQHCAPPPPPQHCAPPPPQHCAPPPPPQHCVPPPPPQHCAQPPLPPHYAPPPLPPHYAPPPFSQPRAPPPFPQHRAPPPLPQHRAPPPFPQHCAPPPDELSSRPNFFVGYFGPQGVFVDQSVAHVGPSLNRVRPKAGHHAAALDAVTGGGYYTAPPARHLPERRTEIGYGTHAAVPAGPFMHGAQQDGVQRPRLGQRDQR